MTNYQYTKAAADSIQGAMKVRYAAKIHTSGGRRADVYCRDGRVQ